MTTLPPLRRLEAAIGIVLLAVIVVLVFVAGIMRWFGAPLVWSVDLAQLLFVWVSFIGADLALHTKVHIGMDLAVRPFPAASRRLIDLALGLLVTAFLLTMVAMGAELTLLNIERQFGDSGISYAFVTAAVPAGCLLLAATVVLHMVAVVRSWRARPALVFSDPERGELEDVL